jgi:hypothetical protein
MKICARCDKPIKGKPVQWNHVSASAGGITVYVCPWPCRPATPRQTTSSGH